MNKYYLLLCSLFWLMPPVSMAESVRPEAPEPGPVPAMIAPKAAEYRLLDITVAGERAVAIGQHGVIMTSDDGETWTQSPAPVSTMLTDVQFTDKNTGWIVGYDASILKTIDGGLTWVIKNYDITARPLFDLLFLDDKRAIAIGGYGTQYVSTDGGETWEEIENALSDAGMHLNEILRLGDGSLFIAGERGLMARSNDEGETWQLLQSPYKGSFFGALEWGEAGVLLYGMRGNVFIAHDAAALKVAETVDWDIFSQEVHVDPDHVIALGLQHITNPSNESLFGGEKMGGNSALFVGVNGAILKYRRDEPALTVVESYIDQTLAGVTEFKGQILTVGRRGIQPLGEK